MNETERRALGLAVRQVIELRLAELIADNGKKLDALERNVVAIQDTLSELDSVTAGLVNDGLDRFDKHFTDKTADLADRSIAALERAATVRDGQPGPPGERGPEGPAGSLAEVRMHQPGEIYRAGEFVCLPPGHLRGWAIARALEDTYELPGDDDAPWLPYVFHGTRGAVGMTWKGEHVAGQRYAVGDAVRSEGGGAWIRTVDGISTGIPGDGWEVLAKRGAKGSRGEVGPSGRSGRDGVGIDALAIDGGDLVITLSDGQQKRLPVPVIVIRGGP